MRIFDEPPPAAVQPKHEPQDVRGLDLLDRTRHAGPSLLPVADQVVYSASNILVFLLAARGGLHSAGAATLVQTGYVLTCTLVQGVGVEATLLQVGTRHRGATERICSQAFQVGIAWGLVTLALAKTFGLPELSMLTALTAPLVAVQYGVRSWALVRRDYVGPLRSDACWLAAQLLVFAALTAAGVDHLSASLLSWSVGGVVACLVLGFPIRGWPKPTSSWKLLVKNSGYAWELLIGQGMAQVSAVAVGLIAGPATVGLYKSAQVVFTPVNLVSQPLRQMAMARMVDAPPRQQVRHAWAASALLAGVSLGCFTIFFVAPPLLGTLLVGASWPRVHAVLGWLLIESFTGTCIFAPALLLRVRRRLRAGTVIRLISASAIAGTAVLAAASGAGQETYARVAPWGTAAAAVVWYTCLAGLHARDSRRESLG